MIRHAVRRAAAEEFGATRTIDPTAEPLEPRYDLVVECVGLPGMTDVCVGAATRHGRIVIAGVCTHPDPYVPIQAVVKELNVAFAVYYTRREFFSVVDALGRGAVDAAPFVTEKVGLAGANDAFRALDRGQGAPQDPGAPRARVATHSAGSGQARATVAVAGTSTVSGAS